MLHNKDFVRHNETYIDISIIKHQSDTLLSFEQQFETMDGLRPLLKETLIVNDNIEIIEEESSPSPFNSSLIEEIYQQDDCIDAQKSNRYIYHIAKTRNDQLYIRIHRNPRLDQGNSCSLLKNCKINVLSLNLICSLSVFICRI